MGFTFFGTDEFSVGVLNELARNGFKPDLIISTPDKPKGRKLELTPPPTKVWAAENNIPILQPEKLKDFELPNTDLAVVASYGKIIPQSLLDQPAHGFINVHPSLLPKYRGATPLETAILSGDADTGVTIIKMDAEMDHGPILIQEKVSLAEKWYEELRDETATLGGRLVAKVMPQVLAGTIEEKEQDHAEATFTKKITKEDGLINLADNPEINYRKIRAYTPWPGAYFFKDGKRIIIKKARLNESGELVIERVIPEGKREMDFQS